MIYGLSCQWDAKERCAWGSWPPQSAAQKGGPPQGSDLELGIIEVELLPVSWGTVEIRECEECPGTAETRANNTEPAARLGIHFRGPQIASCNIALGPWLESLFPYSSTTVCPWTYFFYVAYHLQLQKEKYISEHILQMVLVQTECWPSASSGFPCAARYHHLSSLSGWCKELDSRESKRDSL